MLPCRAVGSYPTFSHLTPCVCTGRSILCGTCRFRYEPEPLFNTRHPVLWCPDFPLRITEQLPGPFLLWYSVLVKRASRLRSMSVAQVFDSVRCPLQEFTTPFDVRFRDSRTDPKYTIVNPIVSSVIQNNFLYSAQSTFSTRHAFAPKNLSG